MFPNSKRWNKLPRIQLGQPVAVTGSLIGLERDSSFYPDYFTVLVDDWTPQDAQMTLSQREYYYHNIIIGVVYPFQRKLRLQGKVHQKCLSITIPLAHARRRV